MNSNSQSSSPPPITNPSYSRWAPKRKKQKFPPELIEDIYHRNSRYWILNGSGIYVHVGERAVSTEIRKRMLTAGFSASREDVREVMLSVDLDNPVDYTLPFLPGFPTGFHIINGSRVLVPEALTLIKSVKGKTKLINDILLSLLGSDQLMFFKGWLQIGYNALKNYESMPAQVLILSGPQHCGKNLTQEQIITPVLGGRIAEPYRYAVGRTHFNEDLFKAAHLVISDQKQPADRNDMREFIRRVASNGFDSWHGKNKEAITLPTTWRMSVSCNEEEADLKIIPSLEGLEDKLLLLRCALCPMPMPTGTPEERKKFAAALAKEVPAFIYELLNFEIPRALYHERFGIKGYLEPDLLRMVQQLDPEQELLELVQAAKQGSPQLVLVDITANELHVNIFAQTNLRNQLMTVARSPIRLGQLLGKPAYRNDGIVTRSKFVTGYQYYTIIV